MKAGTRLGAALVCALAIAAVAALPAGAKPAAEGASSKSACSLSASEQRHLGASYVYTLKVTNLSCDKGKKLVVKYHACRHDNGGADGKCNSRQGLQLQREDPRLVAAAVQRQGEVHEGVEAVQADVRARTPDWRVPLSASKS